MRIQLLCLLVLATTVLGQPNDRWSQFINQHINNRMSVSRCDDVIRNRHITMPNSNSCKETNTFILATTNLIKAVCDRAGVPYGTLTKSTQPFPVIVCRLRNEGRHPHCEYRGRSSTSYIAISCENGFPVHFGRDIVLVN